MALELEGGVVVTKCPVYVKAVSVLLVLALLFPSASVLAQSYDPDDELPVPTKLEKVMTKLGRGFCNLFLGLAEIPVTWDAKLKQGKPLSYLLTVAPVLGTTRAVVRMGVGVYEIGTFAWPTNKEKNFEAIIEPEYIF